MENRNQSTYQPLPQTVNGRIRAFLFALILALTMLGVGGGIIWTAFDATGFELVLRFFFGLWPLLVGGLFVYLIVYFTWRFTLFPGEIIIRYTFHTLRIPLDNLQAARLATINSARNPNNSSEVLVLFLANGRSRRITQQEMSIPLKDLLEMLKYHYQLTLTYEREPMDVHHTKFGSGSRRPFNYYLEGKSEVTVQSVDEICRWLQQCDYVRDPDLFDQRDFWQHPEQFEELKKGDCEDHALWAWRKLYELNIPAEFVVGRAQWSDTSNGVHAWLTFEENGHFYIIETTHKKKLIYARDAVQTQYHPWFSVDHHLKTYQFLPTALRAAE